MAAGFNYARGKAIVTLDGDLQNDPADIPSCWQS
jgi:dolichol-phosphate mannosyltransferase